MSPNTAWFATFAAGFGPLVRRLVERDVSGARILEVEDNAILFEFGAEPLAILTYCRSLFRVLGVRRERAGGRAGALASAAAGAEAAGAEAALAEVARAFARDHDALGEISRARARPAASSGRRGSAARGGPAGRGGISFALRAFGPDDPAPLPEAARRELEAAIERSGGGRPDPRGDPRSREFRLQARADGTVLFLERRGDGRERDGARRRGELPRTTCRLLAEMTSPRPDDVFLDPFCGYGGIALERALASPYRFVFASDLDPEKVEAVKAALREKAFERRRRTFFPKVGDALGLSTLEAGFVGAIATDPPWGLYEGGPLAGEADGLLSGFAGEAARLLGAGGRLVLLVGRDQAPRAIEAAGRDFGLVESLEVLVSGKKASALRFDRKD